MEGTFIYAVSEILLTALNIPRRDAQKFIYEPVKKAHHPCLKQEAHANPHLLFKIYNSICQLFLLCLLKTHSRRVLCQGQKSASVYLGSTNDRILDSEMTLSVLLASSLGQGCFFSLRLEELTLQVSHRSCEFAESSLRQSIDRIYNLFHCYRTGKSLECVIEVGNCCDVCCRFLYQD